MFNLDLLKAKIPFYLGAFGYALLIVSSLRDLREWRHKKHYSNFENACLEDINRN